MKALFAAAVVVAFGLTAPAYAADTYEPDDNSVIPKLMLIHGMAPTVRDTDPTGKAGNLDVDFMGINVFPNRSYEAFLERRNTNYITLAFDRIAADGATVIQMGSEWARRSGQSTSDGAFGSALGVNSASELRWIEPNPTVSHFIRVTGNAGMNDQYTIQLRETTLFCPRYSNAGTQATVILIHRVNPDDLGSVGATGVCTAQVNFYPENLTISGPVLPAGSVSQDIGYANTWTLPAASVSGVPGTRGAVRIAHTCGWGGLSAKAVALEPSTGFSFDTPCRERPPY